MGATQLKDWFKRQALSKAESCNASGNRKPCERSEAGCMLDSSLVNTTVTRDGRFHAGRRLEVGVEHWRMVRLRDLRSPTVCCVAEV